MPVQQRPRKQKTYWAWSRGSDKSEHLGMATGHILPWNALLWHCDVSMPAPQDELHQGGEENRVKAKMIPLKRGCLGACLAWILFAVTLCWGSASAFKRS